MSLKLLVLIDLILYTTKQTHACTCTVDPYNTLSITYVLFVVTVKISHLGVDLNNCYTTPFWHHVASPLPAYDGSTAFI